MVGDTCAATMCLLFRPLLALLCSLCVCTFDCTHLEFDMTNSAFYNFPSISAGHFTGSGAGHFTGSGIVRFAENLFVSICMIWSFCTHGFSAGTYVQIHCAGPCNSLCVSIILTLDNCSSVSLLIGHILLCRTARPTHRFINRWVTSRRTLGCTHCEARPYSTCR